MGQSPSIPNNSLALRQLPPPPAHMETPRDYTDDIPDECLTQIFQFLSPADRNRCSLVCRRWLLVDGQSRHRLSLNARRDLLPVLPSLFSRFDSITKLALRCDRKSPSLNDDALAMISRRCRNLTRLKLRSCRDITEVGMAQLGPSLKKLSCGSCYFGPKGIYAAVNNCKSLEDISIKRLRGAYGEEDFPSSPPPCPSSLKSICLRELVNGRDFEPLVIGSKKLETLKVVRCTGNWDSVLGEIRKGEINKSLVEVHFERVHVSDFGMLGFSRCPNIEVLRIVKAPEFSNSGLVSVAESCRKLRKLYIDGWRSRIGDEGLLAVAKWCVNLEELALIGVSVTHLSLGVVAGSCRKLERLALSGSDSIGDDEIVCIAQRCMVLKKLRIKGCAVSDAGVAVLSCGFPKLVEVKIKKCNGVTSEAVDRLRVGRASLSVKFDAIEVEGFDGSTSDDGAQESAVDFQGMGGQVVPMDGPSNGTGRLALLRAKLGLFANMNLVSCAFSR